MASPRPPSSRVLGAGGEGAKPKEYLHEVLVSGPPLLCVSSPSLAAAIDDRLREGSRGERRPRPE
jgi:hypothetical protein